MRWRWAATAAGGTALKRITASARPSMTGPSSTLSRYASICCSITSNSPQTTSFFEA